MITGKDLPIQYGVIPWTPDETALAVDKVRFIGDEVAAVAAVDEDTANAAIELIDVEYEQLHAYMDPREALERNEPQIHANRKNNNVSKHVELEFGDVEGAREKADLVVNGHYEFHGSTRPSNRTAPWPACPPRASSRSGARPDLPLRPSRSPACWVGAPKIRVIQPCLGGAFGGKSDPFSLEFCVAKLSQITGRPVKMLWTREEVFYAHRGRHPMSLDYTTSATEDGKITGVDAKILIDGGSYSSFGLVTTYYSGQLLTGPYDFPSYRYDSTRVFTNKPPCGPKRGHGSVQPRFAFECQLDEVAEQLGITPSRSAARTSTASTRRRSTASASPPAASWSASRRPSAARLEDAPPQAAHRPGPRRRRSMYISGRTT